MCSYVSYVCVVSPLSLFYKGELKSRHNALLWKYVRIRSRASRGSQERPQL